MTSLVDAHSNVPRHPDDVPRPDPGRSTRHRLNGLDGFRAMAVTVVALYHFRVPGFSGGWIGPELFFVLSGYLITTLLLDRSAPAGRGLSLRDFWIRRVRRLYPAVLFMVATVISVVAVLAALRSTAVALIGPRSLRSESLATLVYYANWHLIAEKVGYFGQSSSLLKHTWSLAIEEQFYLVFPLIFVLIRRARTRWREVGILVAGLGVVGSAGYAALTTTGASLNRVYYSTSTNAYHLLIGVMLAFLTHGWTPGVRTARRLSWMALPALAAVVVFVEGSSGTAGMPRLWMMRGGGVALDLAAALLLVSLVFGRREFAVSRIFNLRPIVWLGSISYGVYLWHYPAAVLLTRTTTHLPSLVLVPVLIVTTLGAATFSFTCVEVVVRETMIEQRRLRWSLYLVAVTGTVAVLLAAPVLIRPL